MARIVVPFRGLAGKQRLTGLGPEGHRVVVLAMLVDVFAATTTVGLTVVVTNDLEGRRFAKEAGALLVDDPGGGQNPAVAAALGLLEINAVLIVNADVPYILPYDLHALLETTPLNNIGLMASTNDRTNTLNLPIPNLFEPLYGPRSAE